MAIVKSQPWDFRENSRQNHRWAPWLPFYEQSGLHGGQWESVQGVQMKPDQGIEGGSRVERRVLGSIASLDKVS